MGLIMKNILLFGGGPHATYCIDIINKEGKYNIIGIVDSIKEIGTEISGYKIIGRQEQLKELVVKYDIRCWYYNNWRQLVTENCI